MLCYCGSNKMYVDCCAPIICGSVVAETAEQLMRSRYSKYIINDIDYLMRSHHASTRPTKERQSILKWTRSVKWVGLEIVSKQKGLSTDGDGFVEFKALFLEDGKMRCIHEHSFCVKENGVWYYKSGVFK